MNNLRDERQRELATAWLESDRYGIIYAAPRTGKCFISINVMEKLKPDKVLIAYPDKKILQSWLDDLEKRNYTYGNITFSTHMSLKKLVNEKYDLVIIDEIHLLSDAQIEICKELFKENKQVLGLTGTLSSSTKNTLLNELNLPVIATYSIEQAIEEGVIADYEINIVSVPLDNIKKIYKGKTEKQKFDNLTWMINKFEDEGKDVFFLRLSRMRIIQNSIAKLQKTRELILYNYTKRILVFCGITKIADDLGIPSYHSKSTEKKVFSDFVEGNIKHLAVCKIGNSGITFLPLNMVIINSFDSNSESLTQRINRCTSLEYNNPEKKAIIYITSSNEPTEKLWLSKALTMFDKNKIKHI